MNKKSILTTVAAFALATGIFSAVNAQQNMAVSAEVLQPASFSIDTNLDFGVFSPSDASGVVSLSSAGVKSCSGGVVCTVTDDSTVGVIGLNGPSGLSYSVEAPASIALSNGAAQMTFTPVIDGATGTLAGNPISVLMAGDLAVGANQEAGSYTGTLAITVNFS